MILFANNATATVAGSISPTSTTVTVATGMGVVFPSPTGADYFMATFYKNDGSGRHEIVRVTQRNGDTMAISRAQEGTVADQWGPGDTFANLVTAGVLTNILQLSQEDVQEAPVNGKPYARELEAWTNTPFTPYVPPVWPPTTWPQTSMVFTGHDTGTKNAIVVPDILPNIDHIADGMLLTIKVANANDGPVTMSVKGAAPLPVKMMDGLAMEAGKLTAGNMMLFWFDGAQFFAPVKHIEPPPPPVVPPENPPPDVYCPPVYEVPPPNVFWVDAQHGKDTLSDGYGLSQGRAWKTLGYAVTAIESHFSSRPSVTVMCRGRFTTGVDINAQHVAEWHFVADDFHDCTIDGHKGFIVYGGKVTIEGFMFDTEGWCVFVGSAIVYVRSCYFYRPSGFYVGSLHQKEPALYVYPGSGLLYLCDDITYNPRDRTVHNCFFECHGAIAHLAHEIEKILCHIKFESECHFNYGLCWAHSNAVLNCWTGGCSFINSHFVYGPRYRCETGSGFAGFGGNLHFFPGDHEGWCDSGSYAWYR